MKSERGKHMAKMKDASSKETHHRGEIGREKRHITIIKDNFNIYLENVNRRNHPHIHRYVVENTAEYLNYPK